MNHADSSRLSGFEQLMEVALTEGPAQRLLMVLIRVDRVYHRDTNGGSAIAADEGTLTPLMVRNRPLEAGLTFADIVADADAVRTDWEFAMIAVLPGANGVPPSSADAEPHLHRMVKMILTGEDSSGFAFLDRNGEPIELGEAHA